MRLTNNKSFELLDSLMSVACKCTGKPGYVIAYNVRHLQEALPEYVSKQEEVLKKYDVSDLSHIPLETYTAIVEELRPYADLEQEISLMTLTYSEVLDMLTAEDLLKIDVILVDDVADNFKFGISTEVQHAGN